MHSKNERLPLAIAWSVLFVAVFAHMPALRGYFAQDDWSFLARGAGQVPWDGWIARPLGSFLYWRLLWPLFGAEAPGYHGVALLWSALLAVLCARVGLRLGLTTRGAAIAGLVAAASPLPLIPVFWVSASQELLAICLALAAIDLWYAGGRWRMAALLCALLSFASKEGALGLGPWLWLVSSLRGPAAGRMERLGLVLMSAGAAVAAGTILRAIPHGEGDAYALGGIGAILDNLQLLGVWLLSPAPLSDSSSFLRIVGALLWLGWAVLAWLAWRRQGQSLPFLALAWSLASLLPVIALRGHLYPYYLCGALVGWAWTLGWWLERRLPRSWNREGPSRAPATAWVAACLFCAIFAWSSAETYLKARNEDGLHADVLVRRSWIAAEMKRRIALLPLREGSQLTILQATSLELPDDVPRDTVVGSPTLVAARGPVGLQFMVPEGVEVAWSSHLDDTPLDAQVLLDDGGPVLQLLGDTANARMYSALIAVAAGQFPRARHDLWNVVGPLGSQVRWAYDSDALPVDPEDLKAQAAGFVTFLVEGATPADGRILNVFEQLFEAVTGEKLIRPRWGDPIKG